MAEICKLTLLSLRRDLKTRFDAQFVHGLKHATKIMAWHLTKCFVDLSAFVKADTCIADVNRLLTMYFGPHEVMLTLEVKFRDELSAVGVRATVARVQKTVQKEYPDITRIYFASESVAAQDSDEGSEMK